MRNIVTLIMLVHSFIGMSQDPIKVMTYNIKYDDKNDQVNGWSIRKDDLVGLIQYHHPGIIGTQEGLKNQLDYMKQQLTGYDYVGVARDDGKEKGEYSAIFYDARAFRLIGQETFWLSATPDRPSKGWDAALPRICTRAVLEQRSSGLRFNVFNVHFDHVGVEARKQSVSLILDTINKVAGDDPVILIGDFNFEPDKEPYRIATAKLRDSRKTSQTTPYGPEATFNGFAFDKRPESRIDYVFINDQLRVLHYATLSDSKDMRYPSDHFPVIVTLERNKQID